MAVDVGEKGDELDGEGEGKCVGADDDCAVATMTRFGDEGADFDFAAGADLILAIGVFRISVSCEASKLCCDAVN